MIVRAATADRHVWLAARAAYTPGPDFRAIEAVGQDGRTRAMVGFDRWTPAAAHLHVAIEAPGACRGLLRAAFAYLFGEAGRLVALATIREGHARSLRLARHLGFIETHRTPDGWAAGEALVHLEMRRDACRWR